MELPFIYEGEIQEVVEQNESPVPFVRYKCLIHLGNSQQLIVDNVECCTMFGGIGDFFQHRARASSDSGNKINYTSQKNENARIGDRVLIAFLGGSFLRPMIIGFHPHPNQTKEIVGSEAKSLKPQAVFQYLGVRITIDEDGQLQIIHKGAPEVKYTGTDSGGLSALTGLASSLTSALGVDNPALTPKDETETTIIEMLSEGIFRVRDHEGQMIEIDRTAKTISLNNNGLSSVDEEAIPSIGDPDNESLTLNKDDKSATLRARNELLLTSDGTRTDVVEKDFEVNVSGNQVVSVSKDVENKISGNNTNEISGKLEESVGKDWTISVNGSATIEASGATIKLGKGKVGMGGKSAELVDSVVQLMAVLNDTLIAIQALTVLGNLGYPTSPPINVADFVKATTTLAQLKAKLESIKGGI
jgi:hypothetical protein